MRLMLGDSFKLSSLNFRGANPGSGLQGLHTGARSGSACVRLSPSSKRDGCADWGENLPALGPRVPGEFQQVCNSIWLLDAFTPNNGATRVLPGSHLTGRDTSVLADNTAPQPGEYLVQGKQGTVCIFSSHLFHGGTLNTSDNYRMAMHGYFTRRCFGQQVNQQEALRPETYDRLKQTAKKGGPRSPCSTWWSRPRPGFELIYNSSFRFNSWSRWSGRRSVPATAQSVVGLLGATRSAPAGFAGASVHAVLHLCAVPLQRRVAAVTTAGRRGSAGGGLGGFRTLQLCTMPPG